MDLRENLGGDGQVISFLFFQFVAWDLDTTGRRLIDEICQVMSLTEISSYKSISVLLSVLRLGVTVD